MKVAFIGLGNMGSAMARNVIEAGHTLTVYNRSRAKAEALGAAVRIAESPAEAVKNCDVATTMLADDAAVEGVVWGEPGMAQTLPGGAVHVGCSTVSTVLARRLAAGHTARGQKYVSAPVFGRPEAAAAKKLLVVAAGEGETLERCSPVFEAIGRQTFVAGREPWQANAVKLCGNFMIASMLESFGEAYATLRKAEVDPHLFLDVMSALFGSPVYANYGKLIADEKFEPAGFALRLGFKDVRLAIETARECASPMPVASLVHDRLLEAIALGMGEIDWSGVARVSAIHAGLESSELRLDGQAGRPVHPGV
jgi:3-hydroxyisobutyrate dehydrogenase-like beta-hydroxyacid dehydrogenase